MVAKWLVLYVPDMGEIGSSNLYSSNVFSSAIGEFLSIWESENLFDMCRPSMIPLN